MLEKYQRRVCARTLFAALGVWLLAFSFYGLFASDLFFGYEGEHAAQARAYVERSLTVDALGRLQPRARGGIVDVGQYVPFALLRALFTGTEAEADAEHFWAIWVHPFWSVWIVAVVFWLSWLVCGQLRASVGCALLVAFGTVLFPYSKFGMETQQTLWGTAAWAAALQFYRDPRWRHAWELGFCLALLALTKITGITLVAAVLFVILCWIWRDKDFVRRMGGSAKTLPIAFGCVVGCGLLLLTNSWRYGSPWGGRYPWGDRIDGLPIEPERLWALLASPNKSIFLYSPVLLLTLPYWRVFLAARRHMVPIYVALAGLIAFQLSVNTWIDERWWFSRLHFAVPLLALPLVEWWRRWRTFAWWQRSIGAAIIALGVWVQVIGAAVNYTALTYVIHPSKELTRENIVWNPQYNHVRFNIAVLRSWWMREQGGLSTAFVAHRHYFPAAPPPGAPLADRFELAGWDDHDLYLFKALTRPATPLGRSIARTMLGIVAVAFFMGLWALRRAIMTSAHPKMAVRPRYDLVLRWFAGYGRLLSRK